MNNNLKIEIKVVFERNDQATIESFSIDLATKAEKWKMKTIAISFSFRTPAEPPGFGSSWSCTAGNYI